ncbi:MAG: hypothetical protein IBX44_07115 [Sulfurospirillum sp.]|nr:hypothetical protein [Sulfurospirillum sp.]
MRRAISIIELIFTIVIIALVFTVIPKVIFALNKSDAFAVNQDAILNTISLAQMISKLPWDEQNVAYADILHVNSSRFSCDTNATYRIGGFVGSRNCENNITVSASLGSESGESELNFDDVDDWKDHNLTTAIYELNTQVRYCDDFNASIATIDLSTCGSPLGNTNLKRVSFLTSYNGNRGEKRELLRFDYTSANIGQSYLHKRVWE